MADEQKDGEPGVPSGTDLEGILDLNFVPQWARKPPAAGRFSDYEGSGRERGGRRGPGGPGGPRERRDSREGRSRFPRRPRGEGEGPRDRRPPRERDGQGPVAAAAAPAAARPAATRRGPPAGRPPPREDLSQDIRVRLVPTQQGVQAVAHRVHATRKAYPVMDLAGIFIARPALTTVRLECVRGGRVEALWQCRACGYAARGREAALEHTVKAHLDAHCQCETIEGDPPAGTFVCVTRCGISGELVGPPNHHSYNERLQALYEQFGGSLSLDAYRARLVTVREPEAVEAWKDQQRRRTVYRRRPAEEGGEPGPELTRQEAVRWFAADVAPGLVHEVRKATVPAPVALALDDLPLLELVRRDWERERRFPLTISFALRAAFRHMHLHVFKVGKDVHFVAPYQPTPLDPAHTVDTIREVLEHLRAHGGVTRGELVEALRPGAAPESEEAHSVLAPLGWLVERGHIIEFFNGTLSVPMGRGGRRKAAPAKAVEAAEAAEAEQEPAAGDGDQ